MHQLTIFGDATHLQLRDGKASNRKGKSSRVALVTLLLEMVVNKQQQFSSVHFFLSVIIPYDQSSYNHLTIGYELLDGFGNS